MRVIANSPSLCPTMFSVTYTGMCCLPLCTAIVSPTKSGTMVERLDQVLIGRLSFEPRAASTFFIRWWSTKGPFLIERAILRLSYARPEVDMPLAALARAKPQLRIRAFAGEHLDVRACRARDLRAFARHHLHAVHDGADRDIAQRQRVARLDRSLGARHELRADADAFRRDHVATLAVGIKQQRQVGAAVGVVLEPLDAGRDAVLVAPEVDQAVMLLVAAALVPHGDTAMHVAAVGLRLLDHQWPVRLALVQLGRDHLDQRTPARRSRFDFYEWHRESGSYCVAAKLISWPAASRT